MDENGRNEHDKDDGMQDMDDMSRSNKWKEYGCMQENVWIMRKGYGWTKMRVKIKDGKG